MIKLRRSILLKLLTAVIIIGFIASMIFRKQISQHRVTKAKIEMMERMTKTSPDRWKHEFQTVWDSMIVEKDSLRRLED